LQVLPNKLPRLEECRRNFFSIPSSSSSSVGHRVIQRSRKHEIERDFLRPDDPEFQLFQFLNGGGLGTNPLPIAEIPREVAAALGWQSTTVYLSNRDAQKIRHHPMHGMDSQIGMQLPLVVRQGDYYQTSHRGSPLQIEVVLHRPDDPKRAYFLVLARDEHDKGIFMRTFYFTASLSRNKMKGAKKLRVLNNLSYFKQV